MKKSKFQTLLSASCRLPILSLDDAKTDLSLVVHIGMVDFGGECDSWRFEWVFRWEVDTDLEGAFVVWFTVLK